MRWALLFTFAGAFAGCYAPSFGDCELLCAGEQQCPDGLTCRDTRCRTTGSPEACPITPGDGAVPDAVSVGSWSAPVPVSPMLNNYEDPTLTNDEQEIWLVKENTIVTSTRSANIWETPTAALSLSPSGFVARSPSVNASGTTMYTSNDSSGSQEIYRHTRSGPVWMSGVIQSPLGSGASDLAGPTVGSGSLIVFTSSRSAITMLDLYQSIDATSTETWGLAQPIVELNSLAIDTHPAITGDGLQIVFTSNRGLPAGATNMDLFYASRGSTAAPFSTPVRIAELNTATDETGPWINATGTVIYFMRAVNGGNVLMRTMRLP